MSPSVVAFPEGSLWGAIVARSAEAQRSGALESIPTTWIDLVDRGLRFFVRKLGPQPFKPKGSEDPARNPFLPFEEELYVADASETHVCLLNKFNVVPHHLLIVTRRFADQRTLLDLADFEALSRCLAEIDGLAFYNGGRLAGASQAHKHLQLVPLPLTPDGSPTPIEGLLRLGTSPVVSPVAALPFLHAGSSLEGAVGGPALLRSYRELLALLEAREDMEGSRGAEEREPSPSGDGERQRFPYNLLITRRWMVLIPRTREAFQGMEINALGFAGTFLARTDEQLRSLESVGPLGALAQVSVERS